MRTREALSSDTESDTSADLVLGAYRSLDSPGGPGTRFYAEEQRTIPLFTPDLVGLMRDLLSPAQQAEVAVAVIVSTERSP